MENRGPPRGFGEQGNKAIYFRETGEQRPNFEGNREQRQYLGTGNIRKQIFDFGGTGEQANLFQGNKGTGTPPPPLGGPQNILSQKSGTSSSGPAGPATTALATFPTGGRKAERHIQGYMSKTNTNKEVPPLNGQLENYWRASLKALSIRK